MGYSKGHDELARSGLQAFTVDYADGRAGESFDSLPEAIAWVAQQHENVELSQDGENVRVHIGALTLGRILNRRSRGN